MIQPLNEKSNVYPYDKIFSKIDEIIEVINKENYKFDMVVDEKNNEIITLLEQAYKCLDYPFSEGMHSLTLARSKINEAMAKLRRKGL